MVGMQVFINGEAREIAGEMTVRSLLEHFSLPAERVAIELNKVVVRKKDWDETPVREADRIEIVHFVGGG